MNVFKTKLARKLVPSALLTFLGIVIMAYGLIYFEPAIGFVGNILFVLSVFSGIFIWAFNDSAKQNS